MRLLWLFYSSNVFLTDVPPQTLYDEFKCHFHRRHPSCSKCVHLTISLSMFRSVWFAFVLSGVAEAGCSKYLSITFITVLQLHYTVQVLIRYNCPGNVLYNRALGIRDCVLIYSVMAGRFFLALIAQLSC